MAVIDLRNNDAQIIGEQLGKITEGLMRIIFADAYEKQALRHQALADPERLAAAGREFQRNVPDLLRGEEGIGEMFDATAIAEGRAGPIPPTPGSDIGIEAELLAGLQRLYPTTFSEELDVARRAEGVPETQARRERAEGVAGEAEAFLAGQISQNLIDHGFPEQETARVIAQSSFQTLEADQQSEILRRLNRLNYPALQAAALTLSTELKGEQAEMALEHMEMYKAGLEQMNAYDRFLASSGAMNPTFANILAAREARQFSLDMADSQSSEERALKLLAARIDINREMADLSKDIRAAIEAGDKDLLAALTARINQLAEHQLILFPQDTVQHAVLETGLLGGPKGVESDVTTRLELLVEGAAQDIANGEKTMDQFMSSIAALGADLEGDEGRAYANTLRDLVTERVRELQGRSGTPQENSLVLRIEEVLGMDLTREQAEEELQTIEDRLLTDPGLSYTERIRLNDRGHILRLFQMFRSGEEFVIPGIAERAGRGGGVF